MKEALVRLGDFFTVLIGFFEGIWEQIEHIVDTLTSGWNYFNNFFLSQAPPFIVAFFYTLLGILVFALISSVFGGDS